MVKTMTPQVILKFVQSVLKCIDAKEQCKAVIRDCYLIEYGRSGRKTWAIEITTKADEFYVVHIYPSDKEENPWSTDIGWMPNPKEQSTRFELETEHWNNLRVAVQSALVAIATAMVRDALLSESVEVGEAFP